MPPDYAFAPLSADDLPLLREWLSAPHVREWWGDPDAEIATLKAALEGDDPTEMWIVSRKGTPFAYLQVWPLEADPQPHLTAVAHSETRVFDTLIGDSGMLGQGHPEAYLRQRAEALSAEGLTVLADPDARNHRAISAFRKAGFRELSSAIDAEGNLARVLIFSG